ncbi:MAG: hypothetical protein M1421_00495 [Candidatus Eremiobacteraeota bacterium]|nr:hypothetical protein [Candidatus Eremiobacteraeota bacterium]MCL5055349.1 hypothetical protein [Bacillota bacterium]
MNTIRQTATPVSTKPNGKGAEAKLVKRRMEGGRTINPGVQGDTFAPSGDGANAAKRGLTILLPLPGGGYTSIPDGNGGPPYIVGGNNGGNGGIVIPG